MIVLSPLPDTV